MSPSPMGLLVCALLFWAGYRAGSALVVGLIASLAFGSTAVVSIGALGGSSPLAYTLFCGLVILGAVARRQAWRDIGSVFGKMRPIWVLSTLAIFALAGAMLFPRLMIGQTTVFVKSEEGVIVESLLAPSGGNITQPGYLMANALTAIALCMLMLGRDRTPQVRTGFLLLGWLTIAMGLIDMVGNFAGNLDLLAAIRTANYAMLTEQEQAGFARIAGAFPEPSSFAFACLTCLGFSYTYARRTGSPSARWLSLTLVLLLLLSTSSTAYGGLALVGMLAGLGVLRAFLGNRLVREDAWLLLFLSLAAVALLAIAVRNEAVLRPLYDVIDASILSKGNSSSGQERMYWNVKSLQAFVDTSGLGVGMGSSRASSWPIAVVSQLGLLGSLLMVLLVWVVVRGLGRYERVVDPETAAIVAGVRASAVASLLAGALSGGSADPGMVFFIALAVILSVRTRARRTLAAATRRPPPALAPLVA